MSGLGSERESLYAVPDTKGDVCYALIPTGEANCAVGLVHGIDPHVQPAAAGQHGAVFGIVANSIVSASVLAGERWHRAHVAHNAMFYELPANVALPRRFVLRERNGATHTFNVVPCPPLLQGPTYHARSTGPPNC